MIPGLLLRLGIRFRFTNDQQTNRSSSIIWAYSLFVRPKTVFSGHCEEANTGLFALLMPILFFLCIFLDFILLFRGAEIIEDLREKQIEHKKKHERNVLRKIKKKMEKIRSKQEKMLRHSGERTHASGKC